MFAVIDGACCGRRRAIVAGLEEAELWTSGMPVAPVSPREEDSTMSEVLGSGGCGNGRMHDSTISTKEYF